MDIGRSRDRFILLATFGYLVLGLAWIFFSDQLLEVVSNRQAVLWISNAKGVLFILATTVLLFIALRIVPPQEGQASPDLLQSLAHSLRPAPHSAWLRYGFALLVTFAMLVIRQRIEVDFAQRPLLNLFILPIVLSAFFGGFGPGLMSTLVSLLGVNYLVVPPLHSLAVASVVDRTQLGLLLLNGLVISLLSAVLQRALERESRHQRLLAAVVSGTSDAIFVKDSEGRYLLMNAAGAALLQRPVEEILGKDDFALFPCDSAEQVRRRDQAILADGRTQTHEEPLLMPDGRARVYLVTKGPILGQRGKPLGLFGIARDVSERKQAELRLQASEERMQRVLEATSDGIWDWDLSSGKVYRSAQYYQITASRAEEDSEDFEFFRRLIHRDDLPAALDAIGAHQQGRTPHIEFDFRLADPQQAGRWICARGKVVARDAGGAPLRMVGTVLDVTERKRFELAQREASAVFDNSYEGIMVVTPDRLICKVNPAFTRITGYSAEEVLGQSPRLLSSGRHDPAFYAELWSAVTSHGFWRGEIWNRRKSGEVYAEQLTITVVRDAAGALQYYIGAFSDISQIKTHEAELDRIAHYDPLTGAPNRRLLSDRLAQSIMRTTLSESSLAVCFLDLDGFKAVNDRFGHAVGDQLLVGVTDSLKHVLRADDTLARLGGDEFVLLLTDIGSPEECSHILERVLHVVSQPITVGEQVFSITASIGVSLYPDDNSDADTLLRHADQAMYQVKESGKNHYQLFDPESDRKAQTHRRYLEALRQALDSRQFELHYQPKVDLLDGRVLGVEALLRWRHPERGLVAPGEFLPHVYGSSLERPLGDWVIDAALAQAAAWQADGLPLVVSVNVSANHLLHPDFCDRLELALGHHPALPSRCLELEVLETAALDDLQQAIRVMQRCRELGVHFALDDFGTGYSSLTYLRKLPADTLKIDQSFVRDMLSDPDDLAIVEGVIRMAAVFDRQVIAEGVESLAHAAMLCRLGCRQAQGYGIARPLLAGAVGEWIARWQREAVWQGLVDGQALP